MGIRHRDPLYLLTSLFLPFSYSASFVYFRLDVVSAGLGWFVT